MTINKDWITYKNGNVTVSINTVDGTRIMETEDDEFQFDFPVNIDMMISEKCTNGCPYCYANCTPGGKEAHFNWEFLNHLHKGTELAVNINTDIPYGFYDFLLKMKELGVLVNITIHQNSLKEFEKDIDMWFANDLIHGLGMSLNDSSDENIARWIVKYPTLVIHVVAGIFDVEDWSNIYDKNVKFLILGYKNKGRGKKFANDKENFNKVLKNISWAQESIDEFKQNTKLVAFDCLGVKQLNVKDTVSEVEWNELCQGEDGSSTFAINLVRGTFSKSSTETMEFPIMDTVEEMFEVVKQL